jgi:hypothetical protein
MSSLRRICASRANGHLSRGPATPQGKLRSARTPLRHGLLARCVALEDECPRTVAAQPPGASLGRLADALSGLAGGPAIALIHRYGAASTSCASTPSTTSVSCASPMRRALVRQTASYQTNPIPFPDTSGRPRMNRRLFRLSPPMKGRMPQKQNKPTARFGLASETWRTPILVLWALPVCCVVIVPCCRQPLLSGRYL